MWDANVWESCIWKFRFISSNDLPTGGPEGLNTQPHSEQPHASILGSSTHTNLRDELSGSVWSIQPSQVHTEIVRQTKREKTGNLRRSKMKLSSKNGTDRHYRSFTACEACLIEVLQKTYYRSGHRTVACS